MEIGRIAAVLFLLSVAPPLYAEGIQPSVAVYYPGVPWYLRYEVEGVLEEYNSHKPGQSTYTMARSETSGLLVSAQISPAGSAKTAAQCRSREHEHNRQQKALAGAEIRLQDAKGVDMEVLVPLGADKKAVSRHVHRFWLRDGVCAKLHASKTPFAQTDRSTFDKVLDSVRFEPVAATLERAFLVPGRGTLLLKTPAAWGFRASRPGKIGPRDIQFMDPGGEYQMMLTLFPDAQAMLQGEPTARAFVEMARDAAKPKAVEPDPQLVALKGTSGAGFYFQVTDKDLVGKPPKPGDWKYLRQGALLAGESLLLFSLLSNVKDSPVVDGALRALREARFASLPK
jgi:hypothetical protein